MTFDPVKDRDCFSSPLPPADQDSMKAAKKESNSQLKRRYSMVDLRSLAHSENSVSAGDWCLVCRELRERIKELEESYHQMLFNQVFSTPATPEQEDPGTKKRKHEIAQEESNESMDSSLIDQQQQQEYHSELIKKLQECYAALGMDWSELQQQEDASLDFCLQALNSLMERFMQQSAQLLDSSTCTTVDLTATSGAQMETEAVAVDTFTVPETVHSITDSCDNMLTQWKSCSNMVESVLMQFKQLKDQVQAYEHTVQSLSEEKASLSTDVQTMKQQMYQSNQQLESLTDEKKSLGQQLEQLQQQVQQSEQTVQALTDDKHALCLELELIKKQSENTLHSLTVKMDQTVEAVQHELQTQVHQQADQLKAMESALVMEQQKVEEFKALLASREDGMQQEKQVVEAWKLAFHGLCERFSISGSDPVVISESLLNQFNACLEKMESLNVVKEELESRVEQLKADLSAQEIRFISSNIVDGLIKTVVRESLDEELESTKRLLEESRAKQMAMAQEMEGMRGQLSASLEQIQQNASEKQALQMELDSLRAQLAELKAVHQDYEQAVIEKAARIEALQEELSTKETELSASQTVLQDTSAKLREVQAQLSLVQTQLKEMEQTMVERVQELTADKDRAEADVKTHELELQSVRSQLEALHGELERLKTDATDEVGRLKMEMEARVATFETQRADLVAKEETLTHEKAALEKRVGELQVSLEQQAGVVTAQFQEKMEAEKQELLAQISQLTVSVQEYQAQLAAKSEQTKLFEGQIESLKDELNSALHNAEVTGKLIAEKESVISDKEQLILELQASLKTTNESLEKSTLECTGLQNAVENLHTQIAVIQSSETENHEALRAAKESLEAELRTIRDQFAASSEKIVSQETTIQELQIALSEHQKSLESKSGELIGVHAELLAVMEQEQSTKSVVGELEKKLSELANELTSIKDENKQLMEASAKVSQMQRENNELLEKQTTLSNELDTLMAEQQKQKEREQLLEKEISNLKGHIKNLESAAVPPKTLDEMKRKQPDVAGSDEKASDSTATDAPMKPETSKRRRSTVVVDIENRSPSLANKQVSSPSRQRAQRSGKKVVSFTGFRDKNSEYSLSLKNQLTEMLTKLGATIRNDSEFDVDITHVITPPNSRTLKTFAACLTSKWLITDYHWIVDSFNAGSFLPEEKYGVRFFERPFKQKNFYLSPSFLQESQGGREFRVHNAKNLIVTLGQGAIVETMDDADYIIRASTDREVYPHPAVAWQDFIAMIPGSQVTMGKPV